MDRRNLVKLWHLTYRGNQLHLPWWHFLGGIFGKPLKKHRKFPALEEANASAVSWLFQSVGMVEFSQNEKYSSSETNSENIWKLMLPKKKNVPFGRTQPGNCYVSCRERAKTIQARAENLLKSVSYNSKRLHRMLRFWWQSEQQKGNIEYTKLNKKRQRKQSNWNN